MEESIWVFFNQTQHMSLDHNEKERMMAANLIDLNGYRKRKSKSRVLEALEQFHRDVLMPFEQDVQPISSEAFEEFMVQVLGDHLVGRLDSAQEVQALDENYQRFDVRLKKCLQTKLKTLARFERL